MDQNSPGRPALTEEEIASTFHKLVSFLKIGLSLSKACIEAEVPKSTAYKLYEENDWFREHIDQAMQHVAVLISDSAYYVAWSIKEKQSQLKNLDELLLNGVIEQKDYDDRRKNYLISHDELEFLKWYATTSKRTRDEFGNRSELTGKDDAPLIPPAFTSAKSIETILKTYEKVRDKFNEQRESNL